MSDPCKEFVEEIARLAVPEDDTEENRGRQLIWRVHRCESQAAQKLALIHCLSEWWMQLRTMAIRPHCLFASS
jgi:hypothetical protein